MAVPGVFIRGFFPMFCWKCGHQHTDNHRFCPDCGAKQLRPDQLEPESERLRREQEAEKMLAKGVPPSPPVSPMAMGSHTPEPIPPVKQPPKPANPEIEETRAIHESPLSLKE